MYYCKKCKLAVIVIKGDVIKACNCKAPIIGTLKASMTGKGGM